MIPPLHGKYSHPPCKKGDWLFDLRHGAVEVGGWTDARISWPRLKKTGKAALILTDDLARAVFDESESAVAYWFGVSVTTVWAWRKALEVERVTPGTRKLLQSATGVPPEAAARGREAAKRPESLEKMAATKRGKPVGSITKLALYRAACAPKPAGWGAQANAWMQAAKKRKKSLE